MTSHQQKSAMPDTTDASDATTDATDNTPPAMPQTTRSISVVLPAHNEEAVLAETIEKCVATLSEIAPDYEIIVVDDGSSDRTGTIAEDYAAANSHIHVCTTVRSVAMVAR